jgi:hypothetical protein
VDEANGFKGDGVSIFNRLALAAASAQAMLNLGIRKRANEYYGELVELARATRHGRGAGLAESVDAVMQALDGNLKLFEPTPANIQAVLISNLRVSSLLGMPFEVPAESPVPREIRSIIPQVVEIGSLALAGRQAEARRVFAGLRPRVLNEKALLGRRPLAYLLDLALLVEDEEVVAEAFGELQKTDTTRFLSLTLTGCLPLLMAKAATFLEKPAEARTYLETAIHFSGGMGDRPELALARLGLAELLLDHYPDEHDAAIEHLDFAIAELRDMKMQPALERALGRRGLLKA